MYSASSITALSRTIGFGETTKNIGDDNKIGTSEIEFNSFHQLVTMDTLLATFPTEVVGNIARLTDELTKIRTQAAKKALADILDAHIDYIDDYSYDTIITTKLNLLRGAFGYAVAITCIEMMMASGRYNIEQRTVRQTYATLKMELEGAKNEYGKTISFGIVSKYQYAVKKCQKVIFQTKPTINSSDDW